MDLPVRLLPIEERWSCHGCGICCRHVIIALSQEEYRRIREQGWENDSELKNRRLFVRTSFWKPRYRLAHREDGYCVFLTADGRCRIHARFGAEAKPLICQMFPYQLVPLEHFAYLTIRRDCPSAVFERGQTLAEQEAAWKTYLATDRFQPHAVPAPPITLSYRGNWTQFLQVAQVVERFLTDKRYPLVRRLANCLVFAHLLDGCRLSRLKRKQFQELIALLEKGISKEVETAFQNRTRPSRVAQLVLRRTLIEYYRLHPGFHVPKGWLGRWNWIITSWAMAVGRGKIPPLEPAEKTLRMGSVPEDIASCITAPADEPSADMSADIRSENPLGSHYAQSEQEPATAGEKPSHLVHASSATGWLDISRLEDSLGALHREVLQPLDSYFEAMSISKRFAVCGRHGWPLTDRTRALAMSFIVGMALLRLACSDHRPTLADTAALVITLDRGETYARLATRFYRRQLRTLDRRGELMQLLLWYTR